MIENQGNRDNVTSFEVSRDLENRVGQRYIVGNVSGPQDTVWSCDRTGGNQVVTANNCIPSGNAFVGRAYTAQDLRPALQTRGDFTQSVDTQTGRWNVSLADHSTNDTCCVEQQPSQADAYGTVLMTALEAEDGTLSNEP